MTSKIFVVILFSISLIFAQTDREKIAVLPIYSETFKSKSAELTEKILDELFKMDLFIVREQSDVIDVLAQQGLQVGCAEKICAVSVGEALRVQKVIFGTVRQKGGVFKIRLEMVDVQTGDIVRKSTHSVQGGYKNVVSNGIMKATRALIGSVFAQSDGIENSSSTPARKNAIRLATGMICAAAAVGFGGSSAYYWNEKNTRTAAILTGCSGAFLTTSIILFVIRPKNRSGSTVALSAGYRSGEYHIRISCISSPKIR